MAILNLGEIDSGSSNSVPKVREGFDHDNLVVFSHQKNAIKNLFQLLGAKVAAQHRSETHFGTFQIHCFAGAVTAHQPIYTVFWG